MTVCTCVFMPTCGRYFVLSLHAAFLHLSSVRHCENTARFCNIANDRTEEFQRRSICPLVSRQDKQTHKIVTDILACHASPDVFIGSLQMTSAMYLTIYKSTSDWNFFCRWSHPESAAPQHIRTKRHTSSVQLWNRNSG